MTPLAKIIAARIAAEGPMPLSDYMALCLGHPQHGYYITRDPLGRAGDFTTAPEISQMFGEMLGLWLAQVWMDQGCPAPFILCELGPGRGTLMADALRAGRVAPGFAEAAQLWLVETSPVLRERQGQALTGHAPRWADTLADVPQGPLFLLANEFFDALPVRQFQRGAAGWHERMVGLEDGKLTLGLSPVVANGPGRGAPAGSIVEICPAGQSIAAEIGARLSADGGAALIVDYGYDEDNAIGDTVQALRGHAYADVLAAPGEADLTAHVDFRALARASAVHATPVLGQGAFLARLGIGARAEALARAGTEEVIGAALHRLTAADQMGTVFKAMALTYTEAPALPAFEDS